jgi:hypothetical protein
MESGNSGGGVVSHPKACAVCGVTLTTTTGYYEVRYREYERVTVVLSACRDCGAGLENLGNKQRKALALSS